MSIESLPDDVLEMIFDLTPWIDYLIRYSQVCQRWYRMVNYRLSKVHYLLWRFKDDDTTKFFGPRSIYYNIGDDVETRISRANDMITFLRLLPNLKVVQTDGYLGDVEHRFIEILRSRPSVQALIISPNQESNRRSLPESFTSTFGWENIEMLALEHLNTLSPVIMENFGRNLKQLRLSCCNGGFLEIVNNFHSLRRLSIKRYEEPLYEYNYLRYSKDLKNLEILELRIALMPHRPLNLANILCFCPNLRSLFIRIADTRYFYTEIPTLPLENLVIEYDHYQKRYEPWSILFNFIKLFPNLKNLAIRNREWFRNENVEEILSSLVNLEVLDIRGSGWNDAQSQAIKNCIAKPGDWDIREYGWNDINTPTIGSCAIDDESQHIVEKYSKIYGRPIIYHYGGRKIPEPVFDEEKICERFNFMENIFYKPFFLLPTFMI